MASSYPMKKNTAVKIVFPILDADGDLVSSAAGLDSEYSLDGGAFSDCSGEATEIGSSGIYHLSLLLGETNGDVVCIQVKTTTSGAKTTVLVFYTSAQTLDELDTNVDSILTDTNEMQGKLPTNNIMGSSVKTDKDDEIDAIKTVTDNLPDSGALTTIQADLDNPNQYKATGFSTHSAVNVWAVGTRALTDKAGFSLAADQSAVTIGTVNTLSASGIDGIWDEVIEGAVTGRQTLRLNLAVLAGKSSGGGTATLIFKDTSGATDRVTATVDANGNRTGMTLDVS